MLHEAMAEVAVLFLFQGKVSRDFLLLVLLMNQFPPAQEYSIRTVTNFFENSRRYSQVKLHHRCQRHRRQNCRRYQQHRRQIFPPVSLVLLIPVANLPPVSAIPVAKLPPVTTMPVANCHRYQRHRRQICHRCQRHRWQIITLQPIYSRKTDPYNHPYKISNRLKNFYSRLHLLLWPFP
jgi:hypothetical protein